MDVSNLNHRLYAGRFHNQQRQLALNTFAHSSSSSESYPSSVSNNSSPVDIADHFPTSPAAPDPGSPSSSSSRTSFGQRSHSHHHHSIQELIRHFGRKVHHWRSDGGYRRASCSEDSPNSKPDDFRERSKSLDACTKRPAISDCEATYRIYNNILKEGMWLFITDI